MFAVDDGDLVRALQLGDCALRNQKRTQFVAVRGANPAVLSGAEMFPGLGNNPVSWIAPVVGYLAVGEKEFPFCG